MVEVKRDVGLQTETTDPRFGTIISITRRFLQTEIEKAKGADPFVVVGTYTWWAKAFCGYVLNDKNLKDKCGELFNRRPEVVEFVDGQYFKDVGAALGFAEKFLITEGSERETMASFVPAAFEKVVSEMFVFPEYARRESNPQPGA